MTRLLTALLLLSLTGFGWASVYPDKYQGVPNTFKDGDTIKADEFNTNNESIKQAINDISSSATGPQGPAGPKGDTGATGPVGPQGPAGGVCSATQQDNSVLIECADGTSGVIAGAGTVVVYPEGQMGETNIGSINTGEILLIDGNDITLGVGRTEGPDYTTTVLFGETASCKVKLRNNDSEQVSEVYPWLPGSRGVFQSSDCSGQMLVNTGCHNPTGQQWVLGAQVIYEQILIRSQLIDNSCSETEQVYSDGYLSPPTNITLPPEILNAAYPVRLEQGQ